MPPESDNARQSFRRLMADERLVQAGAWIAGQLHFHPDEPVRVPADPRAIPDPSTDVPYPEWPYGHDRAAGKAAIEDFAGAGLLESIGDGAYRPTEWGQVFFPMLPLFYVRNSERLEQRFPQLREMIRGKQVLDAGCGLAPYTVWLRELGASEVVGVDCFQKHLDLASRVVTAFGADRVRLIFGNLEHIPAPDRSFDFIYCRGVISLVHKRAALEEFARVLRPGAQCLVMLHAPAFYWRMAKLLGPSKLRLRRSWAGMRGLIGGAAFELLGWDVRWRRNPEVLLAYERQKTFTRLAEACGLCVQSWEQGIPKPFVWLTKR